MNTTIFRGDYHVTGDSSTKLGEKQVKRLSTLAKYISSYLHQMDSAIIKIAEFLHRELTFSQPSCRQFAHIRHLDLASDIHSFFQAYSAARDHYGAFLATQIAKKNHKHEAIDDFNTLLNSVDIDTLRVLPIIKRMEERKAIAAVLKQTKRGNLVRFDYCQNTPLHFANSLRRRFTHKSPYGTSPDERLMEIYQPDNDPSIYLVKAFLEDGKNAPPLNMLRTVNGLYQNLCDFFLTCAIMTGYETDPVRINLS